MLHISPSVKRTNHFRKESVHVTVMQKNPCTNLVSSLRSTLGERILILGTLWYWGSLFFVVRLHFLRHLELRHVYMRISLFWLRHLSYAQDDRAPRGLLYLEWRTKLKVHILGKFLLIFSIVWAIFFFFFWDFRKVTFIKAWGKFALLLEQLNYFERVVFFRITRRPFLGGHVIARPGARQQAAN